MDVGSAALGVISRLPRQGSRHRRNRSFISEIAAKHETGRLFFKSEKHSNLKLAPVTRATMDQESAKCPLCGGGRSRTVWNRDATRIERCAGCGLLFAAERPAESDLMALYDGEALIKSCSDSPAPAGTRVPEWKQEEHSKLLDAIASLGVRDGLLLDVGCFSGMFLINAEKRGYTPSGIEPNREAYLHLKNDLKLNVIQESLSAARFPADTFSVVSMLDVIEHVSDPVSELQEVCRILRPGGLLVLSTPNVAGLPQRIVQAKRRLFGQEWCPIDDVPWHLWGFTADTLSRCVEKASFKVSRTLWLKPSQLSTNLGSGSSLAKRIGLRMLGEVSRPPHMSDRFALFAQK